MKEQGNNSTLRMLILISLIMAVLVLVGTMWMGHNAREANDEAVWAVSVFFMDELAGRREQVVSMNLKNTIDDMETAISLLSEEDLKDESHLSEFQAQMRSCIILRCSRSSTIRARSIPPKVKIRSGEVPF